MSDGIYAALSGAIAQQTALETTATNLANASTQGYQAERVVHHGVGGRSGQAGQPKTLRFAAAMQTAIDTEAGPVRETGRNLDVALPPKAFLTVSTPRGVRYTRAGAIDRTADGTLRVAGADLLGEDNKPIKVGGGEVAIGPDGTVTAGGEAAGRIRVVQFPQAQWMNHEGGALLVATPQAGAPTPTNEPIKVGALEESNAAPVRGMTEMLSASRLFDAFQRAIEAFHDADRKAVSTLPNAGV